MRRIDGGPTTIGNVGDTMRKMDNQARAGRSADAANNMTRNATAGKAREARVQAKLEGKFGEGSVQRERYLRDANGAVVKDPVTGKGAALTTWL